MSDEQITAQRQRIKRDLIYVNRALKEPIGDIAIEFHRENWEGIATLLAKMEQEIADLKAQIAERSITRQIERENRT